jgi:N-acyl-phosphatidylethanolamine-hydrolysing phospholipase D
MRVFSPLLVFLSLIFPKSNKYYDHSKSHHTPEGFTNPYLSLENQSKSFSSFWKMMKEERPKVSGVQKIINTDISVIRSKISTQKDFMVWIGHSTILIHISGKTILTDPIFSNRCSPVQFLGPKRYSDPAISVENLPEVDMILISHNHYDHLDRNSVIKLGNKPIWIVPLGLKDWFNNEGITNVREYDWWDEDIVKGIKLYCLPSQHWSKRTILNSFETLWASWAVEINDFRFWFAGDTGYNQYLFREIGDKLGPFDLSAIPIGAYEPRWFMKNFHVNPDESVMIHHDVRCRKSVGIHWGTFGLSTEPFDAPPKLLKEALIKNNIGIDEFITPKIGKIIELEKSE